MGINRIAGAPKVEADVLSDMGTSLRICPFPISSARCCLQFEYAWLPTYLIKTYKNLAILESSHKMRRVWPALLWRMFFW